ncbi:hypothetical protein LY78DRAFT_685968 [Colletotrichum sublineola]|uniref:Uncharacterized protein n=1 Tax=Colletotrichum sublineola TaxID=1173701 RepID=A0A066X2V2_COLSU|nr:hypothetical protein LY78DRAFT_685968 [Colletotrichum sublineola]KDN63267.1 hypothetical protein CSUB01_06521 [Colletotrichum sublineola]
MNPQHSGAATLPKGFRLHDLGQQNPKTPEPFATNEELQPPSPPRPRLRLKRRVASNLTAPTSQFLASVAAADVPIPSIEEPEPSGVNKEASSMTYPVIHNLGDLDGLGLQKLRGRRFSPPRTPAPGAAPSLSPRRYPNWSIDSAFSSGESTPEFESSRPSTARSTQTSASIFSRFSLTSDDLECISPETDASDHIKQSFFDNFDEPIDPPPKPKSKRRKAPWTKAMSDHLWATYLTYLQDPKVTPFRTGKSCIPPHGVCLRVAREAKRSWRGPKGGRKSLNPKSGSNTPTVETRTFLQWPHTCAATRVHLRELCKLKAASSSARTSQFLTNSPTPFGRTAARFWNRRSTPARSPSVFAAHDMSMSLTLSTSEAMQPQGPMAQLTKSAPEPAQEPMTEPFPLLPVETDKLDIPLDERPRLGSPFMAKSYGPSSTGALVAAASSVPQRQNQSLGHRRTLQSPARLTRSRSNTQKRVGRPRQASHEPRKTKRPSLVSDLWTEPIPCEAALPKTPVKPNIEFSSTDNHSRDDLFVPRTNIAGLFTAPMRIPSSRPQLSDSFDPFLALPNAPPPRLGSPFPGSNTSFSFPNRFTQPEGLDHSTIRPFATVQQSGDGGSAPPRNLADRLAYIDERLRDLRRRDTNRRRSESPF